MYIHLHSVDFYGKCKQIYPRMDPMRYDSLVIIIAMERNYLISVCANLLIKINI